MKGYHITIKRIEDYENPQASAVVDEELYIITYGGEHGPGAWEFNGFAYESYESALQALVGDELANQEGWEQS